MFPLARYGLFCLMLMSVVAFAGEASEKAVLNILINGENVGTHFVTLNQKDILIPADTFKKWRIKKSLWNNQESNISLAKLAPHLRYELNDASLKITVNIESFEPQVIQTQSFYNPVIPDNVLAPESWANFLNYSINARFSEPSGFNALSAFSELGVSVGEAFAYSSLNLNYSPNTGKIILTRGNTNLQWEDTKTRQKIIIGDFQMSSPTLSTGGSFGGILWQSNFRQYGQYQYSPSFDMNLNVETPSHAELYVNDVKTQEWDLLPGPVNLPDLLTSGQGDATLVLTDSFGREQRINQPFYITQQLLKTGLHDFFYGVGMIRNSGSNKIIDYKNLVLFGSHRYGFNNNFTAGLAFISDKKRLNIGASVTTSFLGNSLIDSTLTLSHQGGLQGYLATARYQFSHDHLSLSLNGGYRSQQYGDLYTDAKTLNKSKYRLQSSLNFKIPYINASLGGAYSQSTTWGNNKINRQFSLSYNQPLYKNLTLRAQLNHNLNSGDNTAMLTLNYFPQVDDTHLLHKTNYSYELSYDDKTHVDRQVWQMQKQGNTGEGSNYSARFQKEDEALSGSARYQYKNNNGVYSANYSQNEQTISGNVRVAGSLALVNNEFFFGRPITDSFAVVKVKGTNEDTPIYNDGAFLGVAHENKAVLVPNIQSRRLGKVSIRPKDLSLKLVPDRKEQIIQVGKRTAHFIEFTMSQFISIEGHAYIINAEGKKEYLEAVPLEYNVKGQTKESFIANKGFFYLENVP
ncbi:MAG: fimbrial biogenesis outer membrane usher protein, partial [Methylococcales bacterium]|nr:fimbrial biogenesis outer membrane usher protein [Methylococcales bacterium]